MVKERLKFLAPIVIAGLVIGTLVILKTVDLSSERAKVAGTIMSSTVDPVTGKTVALAYVRP